MCQLFEGRQGQETKASGIPEMFFIVTGYNNKILEAYQFYSTPLYIKQNQGRAILNFFITFFTSSGLCFDNCFPLMVVCAFPPQGQVYILS